MWLLTLGVALFILVHLYPSFAPAHRLQIQNRLGINRYKALFSLLVFVAIACMVAGWRSASHLPLYFVPSWGMVAMIATMPMALMLFFSSHRHSYLRQWLIHPQLLGTLLWALAHLWVNSEARSLVLFGGLGLWALVSIIWISWRQWPYPARSDGTPIATLAGILLGIFASGLLIVWGHGWLTGVALN